MSFYGSRTNVKLYGIHKHLVEANTSYRFGGAHGLLAYKVSDGTAVAPVDHDSGVKIVVAEDSDVVAIVLMGLDLDAPATFDAQVVAVDGSYTLPANTHAAIIEGTLNSLDGETDIHFIQPAESEVAVSGTGKLVQLTFS
jgi:hypothetical protein